MKGAIKRLSKRVKIKLIFKISLFKIYRTPSLHSSQVSTFIFLLASGASFGSLAIQIAEPRKVRALAKIAPAKNISFDNPLSAPMTAENKPIPIRGAIFWVEALSDKASRSEDFGTRFGITALFAGAKKEFTVERKNAVAKMTHKGGIA